MVSRRCTVSIADLSAALTSGSASVAMCASSTDRTRSSGEPDSTRAAAIRFALSGSPRSAAERATSIAALTCGSFSLA